jgi:hypothetical protein
MDVPIWKETDSGIRLPLWLEGNGSCFVVFRKGTRKPQLISLQKDGQAVFPAAEAAMPFLLQAAADSTRLLMLEPGAYQWTKADGSSGETVVVLPMEELTLEGPWDLRFPHGWGAPPVAQFPALVSWSEATDPGIRHFSGTARYQHRFTLAKMPAAGQRALLDLGEVREVANLVVNGHPLGIRWHAPYRYDITDYLQPGDNYLVLEVANTLNNQLVGDARRPEADRRTRSNVSRLPNAWMTPMAEAPLLPSGLLGPVRLEYGSVW